MKKSLKKLKKSLKKAYIFIYILSFLQLISFGAIGYLAYESHINFKLWEMQVQINGILTPATDDTSSNPSSYHSHSL